MKLSAKDFFQIVHNWHKGQNQQKNGKRNSRTIADQFESESPRNPAEEKHEQKGYQQHQLAAISPDVSYVFPVDFPVPVKKLAELDTDISHDTGHMRRADDCVGNAGDDGVLQPHQETEQHDGNGHEKSHMTMEFCAQYAETEKKAGFHNERQRIFTLQPFSPCPVNEEFRQGSTGNKTDERTDTGKREIDIPDDQAIGHAGNNPRHVRGILLDSQKTTRIHRTGDECQRQSQVDIRFDASFHTGQFAQIKDQHRLLEKTSSKTKLPYRQYLSAGFMLSVE